MARPKTYSNNYIFHDDYVELQILNDTEVLYSAKIDVDDYERVSKLHWCRKNKDPKTYCRNSLNSLDLHTFIFGQIDGFVVDHENRDRTDCRKSNLRHVTEQMNAINKGKQSNNTSGHVGVSWDKQKQRWEAHIKLNGKKKFLGYYDDIEDAVSSRLKAEIEYFGFNVDRTKDCNTVYDNKRRRKLK